MSYSSHSPVSVQPISQVPLPLGLAGPISTGLSLSQVPSCSSVVSLKRTKSSDSTVKGKLCASPLELEDEEELELEEELEELELEELEIIPPLEEEEDELDDEDVLDELLLASPLVDDEALELLLEELELLELEDESSTSPPWVTNSPSPPQADNPATTRDNVRFRRVLPAAP